MKFELRTSNFALTRPFLLSFWLSLSGLMAASNTPISVSSGVDRDRITVGDLIQYTVTVVSDPDIQVKLPGPVEKLGDFEVRNYQLAEPEKKEGKVISKVGYTLSIFSTGAFKIPPLTIDFHSNDEPSFRSLTTEEVPILVKSVKPADAKDIRDIKPPVEVLAGWWSLWPWFALAAGLVGLGAMLWFWKRRPGKPPRPSAAPQPNLLPPEEEALRALRRLRESGWLEEGRIKLYYVEISQIIRRYIERRHRIPAMESTTAEVLEDLKKSPVRSAWVQLVTSFLNRSDLVKFAKYLPPEEESQEAMEQAFRIVKSGRQEAGRKAGCMEGSECEREKKRRREQASTAPLSNASAALSQSRDR
ncbi:MAG: hypothetical protein ACE5JX_05330 [Acidobacteriota bacterium]